jgi:hypothetical protein
MLGKISAFIAASIIAFGSAYKTSFVPEGWLVWHSYTDYSAMDSSLYYMEPDGSIRTIEGAFAHAMNGSFGTTPDVVTFMAIDTTADEWDIYI